MDNLRHRITTVLSACKQASDQPDSFPYLPGITASLERMLAVLEAGGESIEERQTRASAVFRLTSENYAFLTSELGDQLVDVINDYAGWSP